MTADADAKAWVTKTRVAYDLVAESYATIVPELFDQNPIDRSFIAAFAELVRAEGPGAVADIGCGPGHVTNFLSGLGLDAFGIDLSTAMVATARRAYPQLRFDVGAMESLELADSSLAGVVAWYSVIHTPPERHHVVFAEFARVLRPGGHVLVAFQTGDEPRHIANAYGHDIDLDAYRMPVDGTSHLLAEAGLEPVAHLVRAPLPLERTPQGFLLARRAHTVA